MEHIEAVLIHGPTPLADVEDLMKALYYETKDKVSNGYAKVIMCGEIKENLLINIKISPLAMISYKSQYYRTSMYLSFQIQHIGTLMQFVNSARVKQTPAEAMIKL